VENKYGGRVAPIARHC